MQVAKKYTHTDVALVTLALNLLLLCRGVSTNLKFLVAFGNMADHVAGIPDIGRLLNLVPYRNYAEKGMIPGDRHSY